MYPLVCQHEQGVGVEDPHGSSRGESGGKHFDVVVLIIILFKSSEFCFYLFKSLPHGREGTKFFVVDLVYMDRVHFVKKCNAYFKITPPGGAKFIYLYVASKNAHSYGSPYIGSRGNKVLGHARGIIMYWYNKTRGLPA